MIDYEKCYQDNLLDKYKEDFDKYYNYIKLFYADNSVCPIDIKTTLNKKKEKNVIFMSCNTKKNQKWEAKITLPIVVNLYKIVDENNKYYNNDIKYLKDRLKKMMVSPLYKPEDDDHAIELLDKSQANQKLLDSINNVFKKQKEDLELIINDKKNKIKNLAELSLRRKTIFKGLKKINRELKEKLKEISLNEVKITHSRLNEISKNTGLSINEVNNWIDWLKCMYEYTKISVDLQELNNNYIIKSELFRKINENFVIVPPHIDIKSDKVEIKGKKSKIELKKNIKNESQKKVKLKIKKIR